MPTNSRSTSSISINLSRRRRPSSRISIRQTDVSTSAKNGGNAAYAGRSASPLSIRGTYPQLLDFLRRVENGEHYSRVQGLTLAGAGGGEDTPGKVASPFPQPQPRIARPAMNSRGRYIFLSVFGWSILAATAAAKSDLADPEQRHKSVDQAIALVRPAAPDALPADLKNPFVLSRAGNKDRERRPSSWLVIARSWRLSRPTLSRRALCKSGTLRCCFCVKKS